jgi:hypothetical protein
MPIVIFVHAQEQQLDFQPQRMPVRGRPTPPTQAEVEQIAAALGVPPHRLDPELLNKASVRALIGGPDSGVPPSTVASSPVCIACVCDLSSSSWLSVLLTVVNQANVAARAKVAATVALAASRPETRSEQGRRRPIKRGTGRRVT